MWYANAPIAAAEAPIIAVTRLQVRAHRLRLRPLALQPGQALVLQITLDSFDLPLQEVEQPEIEDQRRHGDRDWPRRRLKELL